MSRLSFSFLPSLLLISALLLYPLDMLADEQAATVPLNTTEDLNSSTNNYNTPTPLPLENFSVPILPTPEGLKDFSLAPVQLVPQPEEQKPAPDAESRFKHALRQFASGRYKKCADEARDIANSFPVSPWVPRARFLGARASGMAGDYQAAHTLFESVRKELPVLADYTYFLMGDYYSAGNKFEDAAASYRKAAEDNPDGTIATDAIFNSAQSYYDAGKYTECKATLKALLGRKHVSGGRSRVLFLQACVKEGNYPEAMEYYRTLWLDYPWLLGKTMEDLFVTGLKENSLTQPEWGTADLIHRGDVFYGRGLFVQAAGSYRTALGLPDNGSRGGLYYKLGLCHYRLREDLPAAEAFNAALSLNVSRTEAQDIYFYYARMYLRAGNESGFRDAALSCAYLAPESPRAVDSLYLLGVMFSQDGEYDVADAIFKWILEANPHTTRVDEVLWQMGWAHYLKGDYATAGKTFERLVSKHPGSTLVPQCLYWRAKSLEAAGDPAAAREETKKLVQRYPWSFYGLLAAGGNTSSLKPSSKPCPAVKEPKPELSYKDPTLSRAYELALQDMQDEATAELRKAEPAYCGSLKGIKAISALYVFAGDYSRPLELVSGLYQAGMNNGGGKVPDEALKIMYPLGYWDTVTRQADIFEIDPFLVAGIIREESRYDPEAVSPAGAVGLMQLMPGTAKAVCRKLKIGYSTPQQLLSGKFNVPVGTCYLDSLYDKHKGRLVRVLAEYNAGPRPLARWTQKMHDAPDDLFIEGIDYKETRSYVKRVLRNYFIYRKIYGQ